MINEKKISKAGAVTIPSHLRRELGVHAGDRFEIVAMKDGGILLERSVGSCVLCGGRDNLIPHGKVYVCHGCGVAIANRVKAVE